MSTAAFRAPSVGSSFTASGIVRQLHARAGALPQLSLEYEPDILTLWVTLRPEPKPVYTLPLIESVGRLQDAIMGLWGVQEDRPIRYLAYRVQGTIHSLGGDLDFYLDCLRANDRASLLHYSEQAVKGMRLNRSGLNGAVITIAHVRGKAIGGGIDSARACNVLVAEEDASFTYPEVSFNHFPIAAVPILSRHTGPVAAERILLSGKDYSAREFMDAGAVDEVVPCGTGEDWIRRYASRTLASHGARVAVLGAFNREAGDLGSVLGASAHAWTDHILRLRPLEISKLQRIAAAQERMLGRMLRTEHAMTEH
jgi:DSF synthase